MNISLNGMIFEFTSFIILLIVGVYLLVDFLHPKHIRKKYFRELSRKFNVPLDDDYQSRLNSFTHRTCSELSGGKKFIIWWMKFTDSNHQDVINAQNLPPFPIVQIGTKWAELLIFEALYIPKGLKTRFL